MHRYYYSTVFNDTTDILLTYIHIAGREAVVEFKHLKFIAIEPMRLNLSIVLCAHDDNLPFIVAFPFIGGLEK